MTKIWIASIAAFSLLLHPFALTMESPESNSNSNNNNNNNNTASSSKNQELLARELAQLHAQIIKATNAEEDVAFTTRLELKKQLGSLHDKGLQAELLSEITQWWAELPSPQNLVRKQIKNDDRGIDELLDLLSRRELTRDHPKFSAIVRLLKEIKIFNQKSNPDDNTVSVYDKKVLANINQQLGMLEQHYNFFIDNFCKASCDNRINMLALRIRMSGERLGHYLIPQEVALKLLSKTSYDRSTRQENPQQGGQSAVVPLGSVHFKAGNTVISDINPAMEWAMHAFTTLLRGESIEAITAPSAFLSLQKLDDRVLDEKFATDEEAKKANVAFRETCVYPESSKRITPDQFFFKNPTYESYFKKVVRNGVVQASLTSGDEDLAQILIGNNNNNNIDPLSFGTLVIQSLVTVPTDAKDDNIRVIKGKNRLISIDNDRALGDMIVQASDNKHYIQGKNVLYLLPLMDTPVDKTIRNRIKEINALDLIKRWLNLLKQQNGHYNELFKNGCLDQETYTNYFPLRVNPGISCVMLKRLQSIQKILAKPDSITYQQLLSKLFPLAGAYYEKLRSHFPNNPHRAQHAVLYQQDKQEKIKEFEDNSIEAVIGENLNNNNNTLLRQLSLEKSKAEDYEEKRSQSIEEELKFFSDQEHANALFRLGEMNYFGNGVKRNHLEAYKLFTQVIEIDPNHVNALFRLGEMSYFGQETSQDYSKAYKLFTQVIEIDPEHAKALYYLGDMNYVKRDYSKAYQFFNHVIEIDPKHVDALYSLGDMNYFGWGTSKNYQKAYQLFYQVIEIDPKHVEALNSLGAMNYFGQEVPQDYQKAYRFFDQVISIDPKHVNALYYLGVMNYFGWGTLRNYQKACQFFDQVIKVDPEHAEALYYLGEINYHAQGTSLDFPKASRLFTQVIKIDPNHVKALYNLGCMNYFGQGIPQDHSRAYQFFDRVISTNPKHGQALHYLDELKKEGFQ